VLVQSRRNKRAAMKMMRKLLKSQGFPPTHFSQIRLHRYEARSYPRSGLGVLVLSIALLGHFLALSH
jgi:hypothetical protein